MIELSYKGIYSRGHIMGITVKDALLLDIFKDSKILAGKKGLDRIINRVSVFDCPIQIDRDQVVLKEGDFFISNFFPFKDNEEYALYALEFINSCGCSCFCITTEYIDSFTQKLIDVCNEMNFPIISIDFTISYGDIINSIMEMILENQRNIITEMRISSLLDDKVTPVEMKSILKYINPHFLKYITCIYCYSNDDSYKFNINLINVLNRSKHNSCIPYKGGILVIISENFIPQPKLSSMLDFITYELKNNVKDYVIGISNSLMDISLCNISINQALIASTSSHMCSNVMINYSSMGIESLLISFKDFIESKDLYSSIIYPIENYDNKNNSNLLSTLISFVENDGDYKKVSKELFQHENTIRYRIIKIKSILNLEKSNVEFYAKIYLGIKFHKIYNSRSFSL